MNSKKYHVNITEVNETGSFYVIIQESEFQIKINNILRTYNETRMEKIKQIQIGNLCLCYNDFDSKLYRGKVIEILNENKYKIFYVDYGVFE